MNITIDGKTIADDAHLIVDGKAGDVKPQPPAPTARSYVQDGLIAMWDGIENAGWGVHDANATTWKDLVGNNDATLSRGSFDSNSLLGNGSFLAQCSAAVAFITVEAVFWLDGTLGSGIRTIFRGASRDPQINCGVSWSDSSRGTVMLAFQRGCYVPSYAAKISASANSAIYINGAQQETHGEDGWGNSKSYPGPTFGDVPNFGGSHAFAGTMHVYCVRLYSRALTAADVAANYAIDKIRFNLP